MRSDRTAAGVVAVIRTAYGSSRLRRVFESGRTVLRPVERASRRSRLDHGIRTVISVTRCSRVVNWLTKDPEPDVVTIDLGETHTVGPILEAVARLDTAISRACRHLGFDRVPAPIATVHDAPVRIVSAFVLGVVGTALVLAWPTSSRVSVLGLGLVAFVALLGLAVPVSIDTITRSRVWSLVRSLLEPPAPPDGK